MLPGAGTLQTALNNANAGDELVLTNGTYTGSGTNVLEIGKSITIRALNPHGAILDGQNARRVMSISKLEDDVEALDELGELDPVLKARLEHLHARDDEG